jgi:Ca2+/H+ antiporter
MGSSIERFLVYFVRGLYLNRGKQLINEYSSFIAIVIAIIFIIAFFFSLHEEKTGQKQKNDNKVIQTTPYSISMSQEEVNGWTIAIIFGLIIVLLVFLVLIFESA